MVVKELNGSVALSDASLTKAPLGFVIIYFYQKGTPVHDILTPIYEEISRRCPFSYFFKTNGEDLSDEDFDKYQIPSLPCFVIFSSGKIMEKIQVSTKERLIDQMKKSGVLKKEEEITNV